MDWDEIQRCAAEHPPGCVCERRVLRAHLTCEGPEASALAVQEAWSLILLGEEEACTSCGETHECICDVLAGAEFADPDGRGLDWTK
jgi:hypothetical protein